MNEQLTGRFHVLKVLGEGGGGRVLLAEDKATDRQVAVKILGEALREGEGLLRFKQEFRLMASLRHPSLVEVYDFGTWEDGSTFYSMEVIAGGDLPPGPLSPSELKSLLIQLVRVLGFIHARGYVHADVAPGNIRLLPDGAIKLIDFGLMTPHGQSAGGPRGTPAYMAPEAVRGARVDARTDFYSLGALAYQLGTGRLPFDAPDALSLMRFHLDQTPVPPSAFNSQLPPELERVIMTLLEKDPLARFQSARDLLLALGAESEEEGEVSLLSSQFVGRDMHMQALAQALAEAQDGHGGLYWVTGAAGVGKSRLLEEFRLRAQLDGVSVLQGVCTEQAVPYGPFLAPLRAAVSMFSPLQLAPYRSALGTLLPELRAEGDVSLDPQKEKLRIQNAIADLLTEVSRLKPLALLLDDLHWADAPSTELLDVLKRSLAEQRVLILGASRLQQENAETLAPFSPAEVAEMVGAILGERELDERFISQLRDMTAGLPVAIEGMIRRLVSHGGIKREKGHWVCRIEAIAELGVSGDANSLFEAQLQDLSPLAWDVVKLAAVIGHPFSLGELFGAMNLEEAAVFAAIAELEYMAILGRQDERLWFVSGQQAEVVTRRTPPDELRALHTALATAMRERGVDEDDLRALNDYARHALGGDAPQEGVEAALAAAAKNVSLFALSEAEELLKAAQPHLLNPQLLLKSRQLQGDIARYTAHLDEAERFYEEALTLGPDPILAGTILISYGICAQVRSDFATALQRYAMARESLADRDAREWLRCLAFEARASYFKGDVTRAIAITEEALERAREVGDPLRLSGCLGFLGMLYALAAGRPNEGTRLLSEALEVAEPLGDKIGFNDTLNHMGNAQLAIQDFAGAETTFLRTLRLSAEIGSRSDIFTSRFNLALVAIERGAPAVALREATLAIEDAKMMGNSLYQGLAIVLRGTALALQTNLQEAFRELSVVELLIEAEHQDYLRLMLRSFGADIHLQSGRLVDACHWAEEALEESRRSGVLEFETRTRLVHAEALIGLGEFGSAREVLARLAEGTPSTDTEAKIAWLSASISLREGDAEKAASLGSDALQKAQDQKADLVLAKIHLLQGEAAFSSGQMLQARDHFDSAQAEAAACGLSLLACLAEFGAAATLGRTPQAYEALRRVRVNLGKVLEALTPDQREDLLGLPAVWRAYQGDFDGLSMGNGEAARSQEAVSVQRYLEVLQREKTLQSELSALDAARHRLEILNRFTLETQGIVDLEALLKQMVALIASLLEADHGLLLLPDRYGKLQVRSTFNVSPNKAMAFSYSIAESSYQSSRTMFVSDAMESEDFSKQRSVMDLQIRSALSVPLRMHDRVLGVIYVDRQTIHAGFVEQDRLLVEAIAQQAAQAIENARLLAESRSQARQLELLNQLARSVSTSLVLNEVLDRVVSSTLELTGADRAMILLKGDDSALSCRMASDRQGHLEPETLEFSQSISQQVLATGEPICHLDTHNSEDLQAQRSIMALDLRTVMAVPLLGRDQAIGVLYVDSREVVNAFGPTELDLLSAIGSQASIAITNAQLYEKATVDALTRLHVRSFFEQRLLMEAQRAIRYGTEVSVLMMDIDHFKKFNDTYGHAIGDEVLKLVASVIKVTVRQDLDLAARFGGEEMLVLMPETGEEGAMALAERIRSCIEEAEYPYGDGPPLKVRVSIGVATLPTHVSTAVGVLEAADAALYQSKRGGRNRVTLFQKGMTAEV